MRPVWAQRPAAPVVPLTEASTPGLLSVARFQRLVNPDLIFLKATSLVLHRLLLQLFEHLQLAASFLSRAGTQQRPAQCVPRLEMRGVDRNGSTEQFHRYCVATGSGVNLRGRGKRLDVRWIEQRGDRILRQRLVESILRAIHI